MFCQVELGGEKKYYYPNRSLLIFCFKKKLFLAQLSVMLITVLGIIDTLILLATVLEPLSWSQ